MVATYLASGERATATAPDVPGILVTVEEAKGSGWLRVSIERIPMPAAPSKSRTTTAAILMPSLFLRAACAITALDEACPGATAGAFVEEDELDSALPF